MGAAVVRAAAATAAAVVVFASGRSRLVAVGSCSGGLGDCSSCGVGAVCRWLDANATARLARRTDGSIAGVPPRGTTPLLPVVERDDQRDGRCWNAVGTRRHTKMK